MKIKIKREGGFIGITSKANLEFDELTAAEQEAFRSLAEQNLAPAKPVAIDAPNVEPLAPHIPSGPNDLEPVVDGLFPQMPSSGYNPNMRDGFSYSVSMRKDGKTMSMKFDDMSAPPEIVEIFQKYVQY